MQAEAHWRADTDGDGARVLERRAAGDGQVAATSAAQSTPTRRPGKGQRPGRHEGHAGLVAIVHHRHECGDQDGLWSWASGSRRWKTRPANCRRWWRRRSAASSRSESRQERHSGPQEAARPSRRRSSWCADGLAMERVEQGGAGPLGHGAARSRQTPIAADQGRPVADGCGCMRGWATPRPTLAGRGHGREALSREGTPPGPD